VPLNIRVTKTLLPPPSAHNPQSIYDCSLNVHVVILTMLFPIIAKVSIFTPNCYMGEINTRVITRESCSPSIKQILTCWLLFLGLGFSFRHITFLFRAPSSFPPLRIHPPVSRRLVPGSAHQKRRPIQHL
jgi:hypothetical protein